MRDIKDRVENSSPEFAETGEEFFSKASEYAPVAQEFPAVPPEFSELPEPAADVPKEYQEGKTKGAVLSNSERKHRLLRKMGYLVAAAVGVVILANSGMGVWSGYPAGGGNISSGGNGFEWPKVPGWRGSSSTETPSQPQSSTDTATSDTLTGPAETHQELHLQEIFVVGDTYDSYGYAYGGSIPVKKDGMWGAINYEKQVIVPIEYDGYRSADKLGNIVMYKSVFTERTSAFGTYTTESREYFLFDNQGNLLYQGEDEVRASGGMYITLHENNDAVVIEYHRLDGTVLVSHELDYPDAQINGFYEGISNFYSQLGINSGTEMSANAPFGPREGDVAPRIGTVDQEGNLSFRDDPYFYLWWDDINEQLAAIKAAQSASSIVQGNAGGSSSFYGTPLISTMNHGYYVTCSRYFETSYLKVYDMEGNQAAIIDYAHISVDDNSNVNIGEGSYKDSNAYRGFYVDGAYIWYYGPHMVFVVDGKDVLVDFSRNTSDEKINSANEIVTAVYDYIAMADENYWLVQSGEQWGYIDHDGNEVAMFEGAGDFVGGYALVIEDGEAWLINENFEKLENLGQAESVAAAGELYSIYVGGQTHLYQLFEEIER